MYKPDGSRLWEISAEAVKRVDRERKVGCIKVTSAVMGRQDAFPTLSQIIPPDVGVLSRESFVPFITGLLVGAKAKDRWSSWKVSGQEFLLEKLYEYMRKKQHIDRLIYSFDCMEELYVDDDIGD